MPLRSLGALWIKEAKSGKKYLSGKFNDINISVFKNEKKEKENQPDYTIAVDTEKYPEFAEEKAPVKSEYDFKKKEPEDNMPSF